MSNSNNNVADAALEGNGEHETKDEASESERPSLIDQLREKLQTARDIVSKKQTALDELQQRNELLKEQIVELRSKIVEARTDRGEEFDAVRHNSSEGMDEFFEHIDDEAVYVEFGRVLRDFLESEGVELDGKKVADIGTGPAIVLREVLKGRQPKSIHGYDGSAAALDYASKIMPEATFICADIYDEISERFDVIICTEVLEHLTHPAAALKNILSALEKDGVAVFTTPDGRIDYSSYHINFWSPESWEVFIEENAHSFNTTFRRFRVSETSPYQNNVAIVYNVQ